jgi:iron-sulfur cluster repair protein YtfE (RIC family)
MSPRQMLPSQVRQLILEDHVWLRAVLATVDDLAHRVADGDRELLGRLRERVADMSQRLMGHLDLEEEVLVPALRDADAWGDERADLLLREHAGQRERFGELLRSLREARAPLRAVALETRLLVRDVLFDMDHEEHALLSPRVLRDDPVVDGEPE